jgi:hypothetical protein
MTQTDTTQTHMTQTETPPASRLITDEVMRWPGVESGYGRRGEFAFKVGGREIGHLHGDHAAHFFFGPDDWNALHAAGRIGYHPVFPDRVGPAARRIASAEDVADVITMMRLNYDRVPARRLSAARRAPR